MKGKIRYTDEPMESRPISDFLPRPDQLIFKEDAVKVTITLSSRSVQFFKDEAAKRGVQYQRMIRRLLDAYVDAFAPLGAQSRAPANRAEQPQGAYRKDATKAAKKHRQPNAATARAMKEAGSMANPRFGWADASRRIAQAGDDEPLWRDFGNEGDKDIKW